MNKVMYIFANIKDQIIDSWENNDRGWVTVDGIIGKEELVHIVNMDRFLSILPHGEGTTFEFDIS
jgi:hypothetical protein